jgi:hypothetical protein
VAHEQQFFRGGAEATLYAGRLEDASRHFFARQCRRKHRARRKAVTERAALGSDRQLDRREGRQVEGGEALGNTAHV